MRSFLMRKLPQVGSAEHLPGFLATADNDTQVSSRGVDVEAK